MSWLCLHCRSRVLHAILYYSLLHLVIAKPHLISNSISVNMPNSPIKIAILLCESGHCSQATDSSVFLNFNCTSFDCDKDFRTSFSTDAFDAVLCLCQHSDQPDTLAIVEWIRYIQCSSIPIVVLSNNDDESAVAETLYAGADDVQTLPVIPNILNARIISLCSRANSLSH